MYQFHKVNFKNAGADRAVQPIFSSKHLSSKVIATGVNL